MFYLGIIIICIVGTLLHFAYEFSNHNKIVAIFSAVNESTWEHIKIALTPTLLWSLVDGYIYGSNPNYFFSKSISLLSIIILIPLFYYGYKKISNDNNAIINILIFYIVIIISQYIFYYLLNIPNINYIYKYISFIILIIIFGSYLLLTLLPLKNELFKDPLTNEYGFTGHK